MHLSLTWVLALTAAVLWGIGGVRFVATARERTKMDEDNQASKEAMAMAWSEWRTLEVMKRFPRSPTPALVYAQHALGRKDYEEAARRFREAIKRDRRDVRGYLGAARALREAGLLDEADALLRQAQRRFRSSREVHGEFAWNAERRRDWPETARRWEAFRRRFPTIEAGYHHGADALRKAGRAADADALLAEAAARFPAPASATTVGR